MKYYCDAAIVVEGTGDSSYLSSFIEALYIETNGYDIKGEDIDFLENCNKKIIILTDSDQAGETIRNKLFEKLPKSLNIRVNSNLCNKHGKHGVAECEKQEIINVLKEHLYTSKQSKDEVRLNDLISLGFEQKEIKNTISNLFHLGTTKNKEMLKRINFLGITKNDLEKEVNNLYGNK